MNPFAGAYAGACLLLVAAGGAKIRRPDATVRALAAAGRAVPRWGVRAGGAAEVAVGVAALATGAAAAAWVVAACYAAFAAFVVAALRRPGPVPAGCGCFGDTGAPLHGVQAAVDVAMAATAVAVAAGGGTGGGAPARAGLVVLGAAVAWMAYLALVPLPRLLGAVREAAR